MLVKSSPEGAQRSIDRSSYRPLCHFSPPHAGLHRRCPEGSFSPRSGPAGYWGGNIDCNWIRDGTTMPLPVFHPGALLFFGDGHALQGDG